MNTTEAHHQVNICVDTLQTGRALGIGFRIVQLKGSRKRRNRLDMYCLKGNFLKREGLVSHLRRLKGNAA